MEDKLKEYNLKVLYNTSTNSKPIDFSIADDEDNVAWCWGSDPYDDVQIECNHPEECIEWGEDDECGICQICGAQCVWHWEKVYDDTTEKTIKERKISEWNKPDRIGGIVGEYLDELDKRW